jgi:hypothetical protein
MNCQGPCFGFVLSASIPFHHQPQQQPQSEIPVADYFARFEMKLELFGIIKPCMGTCEGLWL